MALAVLLSACGGATDSPAIQRETSDLALQGDADEPQEDFFEESDIDLTATPCGFEEVLGPNGTTDRFPLVAYLGAINRQLDADPELAREFGMDAVSTCDDAARFIPFANAYQDARDEPEQLPAKSSDQKPEPVEKIYIGQVSARQGSVWLQFASWRCSGFLVSTRHVVTAAHCLTGNAAHTVTVSAQNGATTWTGTATGYIHNNFTGSLATSTGTVVTDEYDDIAVLSLSSSWSYANSTANLLRMWADSTAMNQLLRIYGNGQQSNPNGSAPSSAVLREPQSNDQIDIDFHNGSGYFRNDAESFARACKGDSGGPAIKTDQNADVVYGVFSSIDLSGTDVCPQSGAAQRWTKMGPKVGWVETRIRLNPNFGAAYSCNQFNNGWGLFYRCW